MATAVSTTPHPNRNEKPPSASPQMIDVATKTVNLLMQNNLISAKPTDREAFIKDYINLTLWTFIDSSNPETRPSKAQVRNTALSLALFQDLVVTKEVIDQYVAFSGYSIVWDGLHVEVEPL
ncbi:MAG TPA: hypothetical protein VMR37_04820 [Rhabdochlamydiaceae bacterium]|jgi:hypothetical protein|nr:hypothetical protein [Rhabdochlamydiaceae bacterium]